MQFLINKILTFNILNKNIDTGMQFIIFESITFIDIYYSKLLNQKNYQILK